MSQVQRTFKVGGVATAPTSFDLVVVRTDTAATVTTAKTNPGTGVYQWTWTDPAYDLTYSLTFTVVYSGATYTFTDSMLGAASPTSGMGQTLAEMQTAIKTLVGWPSATAAQITLIDQAITVAGYAVATWTGREWWWLEGTGSFSTVASTETYALRTVNSSSMANLWGVRKARLDASSTSAWPLAPMSRKEYDDDRLLNPAAATSQPLRYHVYGDPPYIALRPKPGAVYTVELTYTKFHPKIVVATSAETDLLVPGLFHWPIYVDGAVWLLKHQTVDPTALSQSSVFVETIARMMAAAPQKSDDNPEDMYPASRSGYQAQTQEYTRDGRFSIVTPPV